MSRDVLLTGASGFIGRTLVNYLKNEKVTLLYNRHNVLNKYLNLDSVQFDLVSLLEGAELKGKYNTVIHLAGRVHKLNDDSKKPKEDFIRENRDVPLVLARQLAHQGMKRFIFISSISVHGNTTNNKPPINEGSTIDLKSDYATSKYEAEISLKKLSKELDFELVIIRPALVYSVDAPGNIAQLKKLVKKSILLPFGSINNKRSYVSIHNLSSFILHCVKCERRLDETFVLADDLPLSTKDLVSKLKVATNSSSLIIPISKNLLYFGLMLLGKRNMAKTLLDDFVIDSSKANKLLQRKSL